MDSRKSKQAETTWDNPVIECDKWDGGVGVAIRLVQRSCSSHQFHNLDLLNLESQNTPTQQADAYVCAVVRRIIEAHGFQIT